MKKFLLILVMITFMSVATAQRATLPSEYYRIEAEAVYNKPNDNVIPFTKPVGQAGRTYQLDPNETQIGMTVYDLQSNSLLGNRIYRWDDGTMGAVWTRGMEAASFPDRGTGYNFYDGTEWGPEPDERIESLRTGWPSYAPLGENGEIIVSHDFGEHELYFLTRTDKGNGDWAEEVFTYTPGPENLSWARMVTAGPDFSSIHLLANTFDAYAGMNVALVYSRSTDAGATWDTENIIIEGMGSDYYTEITADDYVWAEPRNDVLAFLCASAWNDMFMMKSEDNGDTWDKTVIWEHPYPFFDWNITITDTFFCVDNSASIALDSEGNAHVVFGINRVIHPETGTSYFLYPYVDGIGYWNEDMDPFSSDLDALAPPQYGYTNSEMVEDVNYIGWMQDVNGNGTIDLNTDILYYRELGPSTMPVIAVDESDDIFVIFSSTTEGFESDEFNYKHLWGRAYANDSWGEFDDLSDDISHIFDECIYPVFAGMTDDFVHYIYNADITPGVALDDAHGYQDNRIIYASLPKSDLIGIAENNEILKESNVSQNFPNPFSGTSQVNVKLDEPAELSMQVTNALGQVVQDADLGRVGAGNHTFTIDAASFRPGVYYYIVYAGKEKVTRKMIIE